MPTSFAGIPTSIHHMEAISELVVTPSLSFRLCTGTSSLCFPSAGSQFLSQALRPKATQPRLSKFLKQQSYRSPPKNDEVKHQKSCKPPSVFHLGHSKTQGPRHNKRPWRGPFPPNSALWYIRASYLGSGHPSMGNSKMLVTINPYELMVVY